MQNKLKYLSANTGSKELVNVTSLPSVKEALKEMVVYQQSAISEIDKLKKERDKLNYQIKDLTEKEELAKTIIKNVMIEQGIKEEETFKYTFKIARTKDKVEIIREELIPKEYEEQVITYKINKTKLFDDMKKGKQVEGAELVEVYALTVKEKPII